MSSVGTPEFVVILIAVAIIYGTGIVQKAGEDTWDAAKREFQKRRRRK